MDYDDEVRPDLPPPSHPNPPDLSFTLFLIKGRVLLRDTSRERIQTQGTWPVYDEGCFFLNLVLILTVIEVRGIYIYGDCFLSKKDA